MSLPLIRRLTKGAPISAVEHDANLDALEAASFPADTLVVRSLDDLPAPVGGEITLPGKTVLLQGAIDLGANALRLSDGTLLRGLGTDSVMSSAPGGVIRCVGLASDVVMREFSVIATGGSCLALSGPINQQLNLFFVGLIGATPAASAGEVSGFDVVSFKDCFFNAPNGLRVTGTTNKVFFSQCPFYGLASGSAGITLAAGLNARRLDLVQNFFKHGDTGTPLRAEVGYTVGYGRVSGTMLEGPTAMLEGISSSDENWWFRENDAVPNSRVAAQSYLTAPATTPITTAGEFVHVAGPFAVTDLTQRLALSGNNELVYTGADPVTVTFNATFSVDPANNDRLAFRATHNGEPRAYSETTLEQGAGAGAAPRAGSVNALLALQTGDSVGLAIANLDATNDVPWLNATYTVTA